MDTLRAELSTDVLLKANARFCLRVGEAWNGRKANIQIEQSMFKNRLPPPLKKYMEVRLSEG